MSIHGNHNLVAVGQELGATRGCCFPGTHNVNYEDISVELNKIKGETRFTHAKALAAELLKRTLITCKLFVHKWSIILDAIHIFSSVPDVTSNVSIRSRY